MDQEVRQVLQDYQVREDLLENEVQRVKWDYRECQEKMGLQDFKDRQGLEGRQECQEFKDRQAEVSLSQKFEKYVPVYYEVDIYYFA